MTDNPYKPPEVELEVHAPTAPALWNPDAAGNWSLLFTPVFGSLLVYKNWQAIGDTEKIASGRNWLIVSIVMLVLGLVIPGVALIYLITWYLSSNRAQARYVKEHWGKDYPRRPWGKPLGIGFLIWCVIMLLVVLVAVGAAR